MKRTSITLLVFVSMFAAIAQHKKVIPTKQQLLWHEMEFYLFVHFGPNTFTNLEWGHGTEDAKIFNPINLDCRQWAEIAKKSGAKGIILTAKHHDGFCLWPSKYSTHTVRESNWKNGQGDVVRELSNACMEFDLKFGIYISPWDRNHPKYGTGEYNDIYVSSMSELLKNYGSLFELWWDGANGEGPNGRRQVYDFRRFEKVARRLAPQTVIFSDIGPDIRWVGNEKGIAGTTNWNLLDTAGFRRGEGGPPADTLNRGNENGTQWIPAECDVSIRPGWFYHASEDDKVKTPEQLFDLYLKSVGRGANFLLNIPPDRRGLIHSNDSASLTGFKKLLDQNFTNNLVRKAKISNGASKALPLLKDGNNKTFPVIKDYTRENFKIQFAQPEKINCIVLQEAIQNGQRVKQFSIGLYNGSHLIREIVQTTIGRKRILTFPSGNVSSVVVKILNSKSPPQLSEIAIYQIDESLIEK